MLPNITEIGLDVARVETEKVVSHFRRAGRILDGLVLNLPNFLQTRCILIESAHRIYLGIDMSLPSEASFEPNPPCSGNDYDLDVIVPLDWQSLSLRFVDDVIEADLGAEIDQDLADMRGRLSRFTTKSSSSRYGR